MSRNKNIEIMREFFQSEELNMKSKPDRKMNIQIKVKSKADSIQ